MNFVLFESVIGYYLVNISIENNPSTMYKPRETSNESNLQTNLKIKNFSFIPFNSLNHSVFNCKMIACGKPTTYLLEFLKYNLIREKHFNYLKTVDPNLGSNLKNLLNVQISSELQVLGITRILRERYNSNSFEIFPDGIILSLQKVSFLFSTGKIQDKKNISDRLIIQVSQLLLSADEEINTLSTICKEWSYFFFPRILEKNYRTLPFCMIIKFLLNRKVINDHCLSELNILTLNKDLSVDIYKNFKKSFYPPIDESEMYILNILTEKIISLLEMRKIFHFFLRSKVIESMPNLFHILGEFLSSQLISKTGSLRNLSKCPSSTLQILGSEKALFKALKSHSNTPKYGILYNSIFIKKSIHNKKGKISRYLSNKCSLAAKIDYFSPFHTFCYGKKFKSILTELLSLENDMGEI